MLSILQGEGSICALWLDIGCHTFESLATPCLAELFDLQDEGEWVVFSHDFVDALGVFDSDFMDHGLCGVLLGKSFHEWLCAR